ncbi:glutamate--tRNA ligase [Kaustia mangrovi]|uniref:Glutamate--tRNA ligase n=1 Tax=Kaustia mangrovi TaxID=2593653 RepID=A0A7S8C7H6_9HYPH|nr:glutamate--tRNA ligase [Kaustia mangrovi]QPC44825.1 glutamate--tRNA ligase [Kaustia mangrovi]
MTVRVRFAPSPTGRIHIGNARTALLNWLFARGHGGAFLLRLDDTDRERSTQAFARGIEEDLAWLGIVPDEVARQSDRFARYDEAVERLKEAGRLYACYETPEELERKRKRRLARGLPPIYDRAGLELTADERARLEAEGRAPHWRFRLEDNRIAWDDLIRGAQRFEGAALSDPVLIRADGTYLYTLPSVVDDIDFAISHVIRGEDHVANTAVQIQIFEALGAPPPAFAHHSLLVGAEGEALSKRLGTLSIAGLREEGLEPMAVASLAATLGTSEAVAPHADMGELVRQFDIAHLARAPARFSVDELRALNARLLHDTPYEAVSGRLERLGVTGGEAFWTAVRANCETLADARFWWEIVAGPISPAIDDPDYCRQAADELPPEPWDDTVWKSWTGRVKARTGRKGRALFMPLRQALTGLDHGPELAALLPLIGRDKALKRLSGQTA